MVGRLQLANELRNEGLMEQSRKRPLVQFPEKIGVVTSPRGAAVHDVLRTLRRRCPDVEILFAGVPVEGKKAHLGIISAIQCVVEAGAQEVLLVRGGGSFEDLMPFNEQELAYAVASCPVPVITGIGHEPDTSIADMVADLRCSTPTAAAEAVRQHKDEIIELLYSLASRMTGSLLHRITRSQALLDSYASQPSVKDSNSLFATDIQSLDMAHLRLSSVGDSLTKEAFNSFEALEKSLNRAIPNGVVRNKEMLGRIRLRLMSCDSSMLQPSVQSLKQKDLNLSQIGSHLMHRFQSSSSRSYCAFE